MRVSKLSRWSEPIAASDRLDLTSREGSGQPQARAARGREFSYCHDLPGLMTYETVFRVVPRQDGCQLVWEVRFQLHRSIDKVVHRIVSDKEIWAMMHDSLQSIRSMSESIAVRPVWERKSQSRLGDSRTGSHGALHRMAEAVRT
jgi:hypothetical protein